jgi:hypothetical protein
MSEDGVLPEKAGREKKIMNLIVNTSIILMSTLMGGLTEAMMNLTEAMASGVAGALFWNFIVSIFNESFLHFFCFQAIL